MLNWFKSLFSKRSPDQINDKQRLRLDLAEKERLIATLKSDLERERKQAGLLGEADIRARLERLFEDLSAPVAQLLAQAYLMDMGKTVQAKDALTIAKRLMRTLEDYGMKIETPAGQTTKFDPSLHEALDRATTIQPGETVTAHFPGISFHGKIVKKAGVEKAQGEG